MQMLRRLAAVVLLGIAGALVSPGLAHAQDPCDTLVIDQTAKHVLDVSAIESAAKQLENTGADVRVRAFQTAPGSLDSYQDSQVKSCASWRDPNGQTKDNLVVFLFSMDHQSALFYGSNWHGSLDDNASRIRADYMNAQFKLGNFTKGITGAMAETNRVLNNQLHPSASSGSGGSAGVGWIVLWVFVGIAGLALLVWLMVVLVRKRRAAVARKQARQRAKTDAVNAKNAADKAYETFSTHADVDQLVLITTGELNDADTAEVQRLADDARHLTDDADTAWTELDENPLKYDPTLARSPRSREDYDQIAGKYQAASEKITAAANAVTALTDRCNELQRLIREAPTVFVTRQRELASLQALSDQLAGEGFTAVAKTQLKAVATTLAEAGTQINDQKAGQALDELQRAADEMARIREQLNMLKDIRATLTSQQDNLSARLQSCTTGLGNARERLSSIKGQYHRSCWKGFVPMLANAGDMLAEVPGYLSQASDASDMRIQRWSEARKALSVADSKLSSIESMLTKFDREAGELEQMAQTIGKQIDTAASSVETALSKVQGMKGNQSGNEQRLHDLQGVLRGLRTDLNCAQPEYPRISARLKALTSDVESILTAAQRENQRVEDEEAEERRRQRRREEEERRRRSSYSSSGSSYGSGFGTGFGVGSSFGSSSSWSSGSDFGGGSSGGWGGDSGGGSSGSW